MQRLKVEFTNESGETLAGLLERPDEPPLAVALFAHCFTCSKDIAAASRLTRALASKGIATLRFDFTGLGNSDGDFANTNFSSNVDDLICAADYLADDYGPPDILIGHSLGGAAVLAAASRIPSAKAIATIGAPATAKHVEHLFAEKRDEIETSSVVTVSIGGREFRIKRQLLDDLETYASTDHIRELNAALLVMHAPNDLIVDIEQAAAIYTAARHPKSFVSLDTADHLLSKQADSNYAAEVLSAWASRYVASSKSDTTREKSARVPDGAVLLEEIDHKFARRVVTSKHQLIADEPKSFGGTDQGPNPYELLLASLGSCTSMTIRMYANKKKMALDDVSITLTHERIHAADCADCEASTGFIEVINKEIQLAGDLTDEDKAQLIRIADRCPVHKTLHSDVSIRTTLAND